MKDIKITIRLSAEDRQNLITKACAKSGYLKPGGGVNLSKFCYDQLFQDADCEDVKHIIDVVMADDMEAIYNAKEQLKKLGVNFNQLMSQIHTERHNYVQNGQLSEAVINKYDALEMHYRELRVSIDNVLSELIALKNTAVQF